MREYKNYIFDFDYTLFDTSEGMGICYKTALKSIGVEYHSEELVEYVKESLYLTYHRFRDSETDFEVFEKNFLEASRKFMTNHSVPYFDTIETLHYLHSNDKQVYIVTGKPKNRVVAILKKFGCANYISGIIGYGDYNNPKPSPESLLICIKNYNLSIDESVYVGDSKYDIIAAEDAGIDGILLSRSSFKTGISSLYDLFRSIKVELFTVMSAEYDIFIQRDWKQILKLWCSSNNYNLKSASDSSAIIVIDDFSELSVKKNGIMVLAESIIPPVETSPSCILKWKDTTSNLYKTDISSKPWRILKNFKSFMNEQARKTKCPFPTKVHYTLIAYNYVPVVLSFVPFAIVI